uniref:hypothetical protein n=1 Tax=Aliarcobacter sp. TaxID=2321116 RepID=UPI004047092D
MKRLFLYLILSFAFANAYDPTLDINQNWESTYSTAPDDVIIRESGAVIEAENIKVIGEETTVEIEEKEKGTSDLKEHLKSKEFISKTNENNFFISNFKFDDDGLYCPPLANEYKVAYGVLIDNVNVFSGEITCTVYQKEFYTNQEITNAISKKPLKKVFSKTFSNPNYLNRIKIKKEEIPNDLIKTEALEAAQLYQDRLAAAKQEIRFRYQNVGKNENQMYLDLSDVIDAVFTFDYSIIDIEQSLVSKTLTFRDGYHVNYADNSMFETAKEIKQILNAGTRELNQKFGDWFPVVFDPDLDKQIEEKKSNAVRLMDTSINSVLYFFIKYNEVFEDIFNIFLILVVSFMGYQVTHFYTENFKHLGDANGRKYLFAKSGFVIISAVLLATLSMTSEDYKFELDGKETSVNTSKLQSLTTIMAGYVNETGDLLAEGVIDSYANNLFSNAAATSTSIVTSAINKLKYEKIREINTAVVDDCIDTFDLRIIKSNFPTFFEKNKNENLFIPDELAQKNRTESIYNPINLGGFVKNQSKFEEKGLTLNACFNARKDLESISRKIDFMNSKIEAFNNLNMQEVIYAQKEFILDKLYSDYYKYGYVSVANINIIDSYIKMMELPQKKGDDWSNILLNFDTKQLVGYMAENSALMLTVGEPVQEIVSKSAKVVSDGLVGWIPFIGGALSSSTSGAAGYLAAVLYVDLLDELIPSLRGLFLWALEYFMFMLMFIAKFIAFLILPFALLYVFISGSSQRSAKLIIKIVSTYIKPIVFIPIIFLTVFVLDFTHNYLYLGLDVMKQDLTFSGSILETVGVGLLVSVAKIFVVILEFIIAFQFVISGSRAVIETFEIAARDISDSVTDSVASTFQSKIIK